MGTARRIGLWAVAVYLIFFLGGSYSFGLTHDCVRSHTVESESEDAYGRIYPGEETVCDWYTANGKRWTLGDPIRALHHSRELVGEFFSVGLALLIIGIVLRGQSSEARSAAFKDGYLLGRFAAGKEAEKHDPLPARGEPEADA